MNTALPQISIILPTFNRARLIERAVRSVLEQSATEWELVIVDDGSTDNTFEVVQPIVVSDARIRYHYAANKGLAGARNIGLQLATADFVTFLDSDDTYHPDHLKLRLDYLRAHPETQLLHGGIEVIGPDRVADKFDPCKTIALSECVIGGTFVIRRDLLTQLGGFRNVLYGDDRDFFDRAEASGATIDKLDWPTYVYNRLEPDSLCAIVEREGLEGIERYRSGVK